MDYKETYNRRHLTTLLQYTQRKHNIFFENPYAIKYCDIELAPVWFIEILGQFKLEKKTILDFKRTPHNNATHIKPIIFGLELSKPADISTVLNPTNKNLKYIARKCRVQVLLGVKMK